MFHKSSIFKPYRLTGRQLLLLCACAFLSLAAGATPVDGATSDQDADHSPISMEQASATLQEIRHLAESSPVTLEKLTPQKSEAGASSSIWPIHLVIAGDEHDRSKMLRQIANLPGVLLHRVDPKTGDVSEIELRIPLANEEQR